MSKLIVDDSKYQKYDDKDVYDTLKAMDASPNWRLDL